MAETQQHTPRSPLVGEHDCAFRAVGEGSAANTRSVDAASKKDSPLTLPAMRLAQLRAQDRGGKPSPTRGRGGSCGPAPNQGK
jgi:hypothetical protein